MRAITRTSEYDHHHHRLSSVAVSGDRRCYHHSLLGPHTHGPVIQLRTWAMRTGERSAAHLRNTTPEPHIRT
jgi:hypothetical protein